MNDLLLQSKEIINQAIKDYKPKAVVLMFSGGDDSLTTYEVLKQLNVKVDFVIHGNTRTGIEQTTEFAIKEVERRNDKLLIADAGNSYVNYVMRKGFFGKGHQAHKYSYHILKQKHFRRAVSVHIRHRRKKYPILFLNGARQDESPQRMKHFISPFTVSPDCKSDIWVNVINHWTKHQCKTYLDGNAVQRNPVSVKICRSGECMCGTMQNEGDRQEAAFFYPKWHRWLIDLEIKAYAIHGMTWNDAKPLKNTGGSFQPMCTGCKIAYNTGGVLLTTASAGSNLPFVHL